MRAVEVTETGGPEVLRNAEKPTSSPGAGSVYLIRTHDEFAWRTNQLFDAIATGTVTVNASAVLTS
jgi:hypothetical protein